MKFKFRNSFSLLQLLLVVAVIGLLGAIAMPANAQLTSTSVKAALTNVIMVDRAVTNFTGGQLITNAVSQGKHLGISYTYVGRDATNTGLFALRFKLLTAGANGLYTTSYTTITDTANGTTPVVGWQVIPEYTLGPADKVVFAQFTNANANVGVAAAGCGMLTNVFLQWRN